MDTMGYYKLIRNSVQLFDVELVSMNCSSKKIDNSSEEVELPLILHRDVNIIDNDRAEIYLRTIVGSEEGPFMFDIVYRGTCVTFLELDKNQLEQYAYNQVVPLLLPYVRECVASTMARMGLPIYTIPTMDVLDSLEANLPLEGNQE